MLAASALLLLLPASGQTHPLGNFSINRYTALRVAGDAIDIRYVVDLAEIPTFQVLQESGITTDPADPRRAAYATRMAATLREGLTLVVNGERPSLDVVSHTMAFPPGAGGLPTLKIAVGYRATLAARGDLRIAYRDVNFAERAGWKEIIAVGNADVPITESSVPDRDRSRELSDYPAELLASPPQVTEAHVTAMRHEPTQHAAAPPLLQRRPVARAALPAPAASPSGSSASPASPPEEAVAVSVNASSTPRSAFTELAAVPALSAGLVLVAVVVAAGLGALHALEPGHGKSVVAAYLVGSRGTARHAVLLGLIVTASHTVGVYLLGAVTLYASRTVMPERLYPWLGALSGMIIALVGFTLFVKRIAGSQVGHHHHHLDPDDSDRDDHHGHAHHGHAHHDGHHHHEHHHVPAGGVSLRALFALGVTGGIVPCPGALVVLLSAISLGRLGFGLVLITAFSAGLAAVLVILGLILVHARRALARFSGESALLTRWLPLASSVVVTVLGVAIAVQALIAGGILQVRLS